MKKFFSTVICSKGYTSAYHSIYKNDPSAKVYIIYGGNDYERAVFFNRLIKNFKGYNITAFNPFYDESVDGIYIENLNTYIISDGGFAHIAPVLAGVWEKYYPATTTCNYPLDLRREILILKAKENNAYKNGCAYLHKASIIKEKIHKELLPFLNDDKIINYVRRFCGKSLKPCDKKHRGEIRLLSSATPLGIHTHYDTIFEMCDTTISICDDFGLVGSVLLGIIKDYAISEKIPFIMCPSYFAGDIPQMLIFPHHSLCLTISDENHKLPFEPQERVNIARFLTDNTTLSSQRLDALKNIENKLLEDAVLNIYEGRDYRHKYTYLTKGYTEEVAKENADKLTEMLIN